jgi:hypothetical protein
MKRIVVEGMRGKSEVVTLLDSYLTKRNFRVLSKVTGLDPIICENGNQRLIDRRNGFLLDHENKRCLQLSKDKDFVIFEDQGISPYTMKLFHNIIKPHMILVPNIRLEHQEYLGETITEISENFAIHFDIPELIITTEQKESVLKIFRSYAKKYGKQLIELKCNENIPSISNLYLVDEALKRLTGNGLTKQEWDEHKQKLLKRYSIKKSKENIKYFISSKVNDVGSSLITYEFLSKHYQKEKLCYVAYFRADRKDRAISFIHFFNRIGVNNNVDKIFLRGDFCDYVYKKLKEEVKQKTDIIEKVKIKEVMDYCKDTGHVLVTSVNSVNGFMKKLEENLEKSTA